MAGSTWRSPRSAGFDYHDHSQVVQGLTRVGLDAARSGCGASTNSAVARCAAWCWPGCWPKSPRVLILDEPLAGLDAASQRGLLSVLEDLRRNTGFTVVVISHDFSGLEELCPRTLHLEKGVIAPSPSCITTGGMS